MNLRRKRQCVAAQHDWQQGTVSRWCKHCWVVQPVGSAKPPRVATQVAVSSDRRRKAKTASPKTRIAVAQRDGLDCVYCGQLTSEALPEDHPLRTTIDHRIPRALGGTNALSNLVVACRACNGRKADLPADQFVAIPPKGLNARQLAQLSFVGMNRHTRSHFRRDGRPKRPFATSAEACDVAEYLAEKDGLTMQAFECAECQMWHVRIWPGGARILARQRTRWFDPALFAELGPRAIAQLRDENQGSRGRRRVRIAAHCGGAQRRAKKVRVS